MQNQREPSWTEAIGFWLFVIGLMILAIYLLQ
jgi:hypothetical protein